MSYCESTKSAHHVPACYRSALSCVVRVHTHSGNACFKRDGTLKCSYPEHTHTTSCYGAVGPLCGGT